MIRYTELSAVVVEVVNRTVVVLNSHVAVEISQISRPVTELILFLLSDRHFVHSATEVCQPL